MQSESCLQQALPIFPANRDVPWDVAANIIRQVDWDTLKSISVVCRDFEDEAGRYLWRKLSIDTLGQSYDDACKHVQLKLKVLNKRVKHVKEVTLGIYSGYCSFWQRTGHEVENVLLELFSLLGQSSLQVFTVNLDAYGAAVVPCLQSHLLPSTIQHLTLSNQTQHNLDFVIPCLPNLVSLKLRALCTTRMNPDTTLEPIVSGGVLPKLTTLEVDRADQLLAFQNCALPSLQTLNVIALCTFGLEDILVNFLASFNPTPPFASTVYSKHCVVPPTLRNLSLRMTCKSAHAPNPSMVYYGLLMHPLVVASRALERLRSLHLAHNCFPSEGSRDDAFGTLLPTLEELETFVWEVRDPGLADKQSLGEDILEKLAGECQQMSLLARAISELSVDDQPVCPKKIKSRLTTVVIKAQYVHFRHPYVKSWRNMYSRRLDPWLSEDERWWTVISDDFSNF